MIGLWHLGTVTAACLSEHFEVTAWDPDESTMANLLDGRPPLFEPGLADLIDLGRRAGRLRIEHELETAVRGADVVWIAFDTPIGERDRPDAAFVERRVQSVFPYLAREAVVLITSQLPVGSTRRLAHAYRAAYPSGCVEFAYSPENLRLGNALESFRRPKRLVVGMDEVNGRGKLDEVLRHFGAIEWMRIESAEMAKHAINAFLAVSVVLVNEIARICERRGADIREVERALRSEPRIGDDAYVSAGMGISGGTLTRDLAVLYDLGAREQESVALIAGAIESNEVQLRWVMRRIEETIGNPAGKHFAVLGLTYKPGTDTLRGSAAVALCEALLKSGATVTTYDPVVRSLPMSLANVRPCSTALEALAGADAAIISTEWPEIRSLEFADFVKYMKTPNIFDPKAVLQLRDVSPNLRYFTVGVGERELDPRR